MARALAAEPAGSARPAPGFAGSEDFPARAAGSRSPFDSAPHLASWLVAGSWLAKPAGFGSFVPESAAAGSDSEVGIKKRCSESSCTHPALLITN